MFILGDDMVLLENDVLIFETDMFLDEWLDDSTNDWTNAQAIRRTIGRFDERLDD